MRTRDIRTRQKTAFGILAFILFISLAVILAFWYSYPFTWTHTSTFWFFNRIDIAFNPESSKYALLGIVMLSACRKAAPLVGKKSK